MEKIVVFYILFDVHPFLFGNKRTFVVVVVVSYTFMLHELTEWYQMELKEEIKYVCFYFAVRATAARYNQPTERHIGIKQFVCCMRMKRRNKKKKEAHTQNPFGSGGFCASGRFVFEYCNTCMRIYWIHAYAEVRDQQAQTICERKAIWLLATATYCMSVTHSYSTTSIDTIIHSHSILYSICACTGVCVCVQLDVCSLSSIYEHTTDKTTK